MGKDAVSIKGTKSGLVILLDSSRKFEDLKHHLRQKMESSKGFFSGAKFTFFAGPYKLVPHQQYELESICRQYGLIPNKGPVAPEIKALYSPTPKRKNNTSTLNGEPALLIKRTLRSGQSVSHPSHIIILGNVHPGAKVEAGGNILVMGHCAGTVHAGTKGDKKAIITAIHLSPQVLRITDLIHLAPPPPLGTCGPHKAFIKNNKIIFATDG